jgi:IMP dehydrogenase
VVFRKDYEGSKEYPRQLVDAEKRYMVGAAVSTWDYKERVPALVAAGADVLFVDSSDGYNEFQADAIRWVKETQGDDVKIGGGNVVHPDAFRYLVEAGADFVKIGVGGGSICTTREQKGIGRGQASAILDVAADRDAYCKETGVYIPLCADGGIVHDYHIALALAMGADFIMLGRYFARFDESPGKKTQINNQIVKEHWGEGTARSANWQRYSDNGKPPIVFEEGVDSFVPYAGPMEGNLNRTLAKLKSTMISCGSVSIADFQKNSLLTEISSSSIVEGGAHDLIARPVME